MSTARERAAVAGDVGGGSTNDAVTRAAVAGDVGPKVAVAANGDNLTRGLRGRYIDSPRFR